MYRKAQNRFLNLAMVFILLFSFYPCLAEEKVEVPKEIMQKIEKIVDSPSCFAGVDGMVRKSKKARIKDMIDWYKKYENVNGQYNDWGLDIKKFRKQEDFLDAKTVYNDRALVHHGDVDPKKHRYYGNKFKFYKIMVENNLQDKTAKVIYAISQEKVVFPEGSLNLTVSEVLKTLDNGKYICKPQNLADGHGVYLIEKNNGVLSCYNSSYKKIDSDKFLKKVSEREYIIQEYIYQHERLKKFNPYSLNTLRIYTTRYGERTHILEAFLRMGIDNSVVDNANAGGTLVGINLKTGVLRKYGCYFSKYNKQIALEHPMSHIKYEGYKLPYWKEIIKLVKEAHKVFYGLSSIGWDVAITEKGPVIIELNWGYGFSAMQVTNGGLKDKWHTLKKM